MKKNYKNNKKSGNPSNDQQNVDQDDQNSSLGDGRPRPSARNFERMKAYNAKRAGKTDSQKQKDDTDNQTDTVKSSFKEMPRTNRKFRKPPSKTDGPIKTEVPSAPSSVTMYEGQACGGQAVASVNSHNYDFAMMPCLLHEMHNMLIARETTLTRTLPYCVLQHYFATILNAVLIKRVILQNADNRFAAEVDPFDTIHADNLYIPTPFISYLNGFGVNLLQSGDRVYPNLPSAGTPRMKRRVANNDIPSGTFNFANANSHNAYECYMSPYVTKSLIEQTLAVYGGENAEAWMPLPAALVPPLSIATPNLLGYEIPEIISGETANILQRFEFCNENTMAGRLCYSDELMNHVSGILHERSDKFRMVRGIPSESSINPAAFIYTDIEVDVANTQLLANTHGTTCSSEAFGASASNMANYFSYHRKRSNGAPGYCLINADGTPIAGWQATINSNYNMTGNFAPIYGLDYPYLRSLRFKSGPLSGTCEASLRTWLDKEFNLRT